MYENRPVHWQFALYSLYSLWPEKYCILEDNLKKKGGHTKNWLSAYYNYTNSIFVLYMLYYHVFLHISKITAPISHFTNKI